MRALGLLFVVVLCALSFWGGLQWERRNCKVDFPNRFSQIDNSIVCEGFRSDLPKVPDPTVVP